MRECLKWSALVLMLVGVVCLGCACGAGSDEETTATTTTTAATTVTTTTTRHGVLDTGGLRVRSGPGLDYDEIGSLEYQQEIVVLDQVGDWYLIVFGDGAGYINAHYVDMDDAPNASEMAASLPTTTTTATTTAATTLPGQTTTTVSGATGAVATTTAAA